MTAHVQPDRAAAPSSPRAWLVALALYVALAIASTWPLARHADDALPLGTDTTATVPLVSAWAMWWNADRLAHGLDGYWQAPIFYPTDDAFALSEAMPLAGLVMAPVTWLGGPALAHNLWLLLALVLNGLAIRGLARACGAGPPAALLTGALGVLLPFVHGELGVLALVPVFAVVWTLHATLRLARGPTWQGGVRLGAALGVTYLLCGQFAIFVTLAAVGPGAWLLGPALRSRATWAALAVAALVALLLAAPLAVAQARAVAHHGLTRTAARIESGAATGWAWSRAPAERAVPVPTIRTARDGQRALFPGWLALGLAGAALAQLVRRPDRRAARFVALVGGAAIVLSLAPRLPGVATVMHHVPGLGQIRSFWRVAMVAHVAIVVLAALGVEALLARAADRARWRTAAWLAAALALLEPWPAAQRLAPVPSRATHAALLAWVDAHVPPGAPLMYLPGPASGRVADYEPAARAMYVATWHGHPLVGGYSSYFPAAHEALHRAVRAFPSRAADDALAAHAIAHLIVTTAWLDDAGRRARLATSGWRVAHVDAGLGVEVVVRAP